jgi:hypothetical protein
VNKIPDEVKHRIKQCKTRVVGPSQEELNTIGEIELNLQIKNKTFTINAIVVTNLHAPLILGVNFLSKYNTVINFSNKTVTIDDVTLKINPDYLNSINVTVSEYNNKLIIHNTFMLPPKQTQIVPISLSTKFTNLLTNQNLLDRGIYTKITHTPNGIYIHLKNDRIIAQKLYPNQNIGELQTHHETMYHTIKDPNIHSTLPTRHFQGDEDITDFEGNVIKINRALPLHQRKQALELIYKYRHLFTTDVEKIKIVKAKPYRIRLKSTEPVHCSEYQLGHREREKAMEIIRKLQSAKVIEPSNASYRSPFFIKKKKDSSIRLLVDYRKLNRFVHMDRNSVIRPSILIEKLHKMKYFNLCDLISGYYQLPLHKDSRDCTSFAIDGKLFRFCTLPQGLCCSSAAMAQTVNEIFQDEIYDNIMATYVDDFLSYSDSFTSGLTRLERILKKIDQYNFRFKTTKSEFFATEIDILGFHVSNNTIQPSKKNIETILKLKAPRTVRQVRQLLGMYGFFRTFIRDFSGITKPITDLLKNRSKDKKEPIIWGEEQEKAFQILKKEITSPPILQIFDPDKPTFVEVDASSTNVAGILTQIDPRTGNRKPVSYYSSKLPPTKGGRSSFDIELIALSRSLTAFRPYLIFNHFTVLTDNQALATRAIHSRTLNVKRLARINDVISQFSFDIKHISGKNNVLADCLSRANYEEKINNVCTLEPPTTITNEEFIAEQNKDRKLKAIRDIKTNVLLSPNDYTAHERKTFLRQSRRYSLNKEGILCAHKFNKRQLHKLIAIPSQLVNKVIQMAHEGLATGNHFGRNKTLLRLSTKFHWNEMWKDISQYVKSCDICQKNKRKYIKEGHIKERKLDNRYPPIFQHLSVDVLGPYSFGTNKLYVIAAVDKGSKFLIAQAFHSMNSDNVIEFMENIITQYILPRTIHFDNASYFTSEKVANFLKLHEIKPSFSIPYFPQTNGQAEHHMGQLNIAIKSLLASGHKPSEIPRLLKFVQRAYNTCPHPGLPNQVSPAYLVFGIEDTYIEAQLRITSELSTSRKEELETLMSIRNTVPAILHSNFEIYAENYNKGRKNVEYEIGDKILLKNDTKNKLEPKFSGPYEIIDKISSTVYIIQLPDRKFLTHIGLLKKYYARND